MAKYFLDVVPICLKKWVLKPKCAVTNVDLNTSNLTFEFALNFLAKDEQNLLGTTSNYLKSSHGTTRNFKTVQALKLKEIFTKYQKINRA